VTNPWIKRTIGVLVTAIVVALAVISGRWLWIHYNVEPWTRDGRIRADVVLVGPDINGLVTEVGVRDNEVVKKGDVLFVIDRPRYDLSLRQAAAAIDAAQAALDEAVREANRNKALGNLATTEQVEQGISRIDQYRAQLEAAQAQRDVAQLNLERTTIRATVNGVVTNMELQPGDYATVGRQVMAIVNTDSIYIDGYFEETKLPYIQVGDRALIHVMGLAAVLHGRVEGIAAGIEDRERGPSGNALANVNPTFSWVRLAQRIPVRIRLENVPNDVRLIAGRTATVSIEVPANRPLEGSGH
jgi:multidrug resistance efflux pump